MPKVRKSAKRSRSAPRKTRHRGYKPKGNYYNPLKDMVQTQVVTQVMRYQMAIVTNTPNMNQEIKFTVRWMQPANNQGLASGDMCIGIDSNSAQWNAVYRNY